MERYKMRDLIYAYLREHPTATSAEIIKYFKDRDLKKWVPSSGEVRKHMVIFKKRLAAGKDKIY